MQPIGVDCLGFLLGFALHNNRNRERRVSANQLAISFSKRQLTRAACLATLERRIQRLLNFSFGLIGKTMHFMELLTTQLIQLLTRELFERVIYIEQFELFVHDFDGIACELECSEEHMSGLQTTLHGHLAIFQCEQCVLAFGQVGRLFEHVVESEFKKWQNALNLAFVSEKSREKKIDLNDVKCTEKEERRNTH